jgi:hypothetical protein
MSTSIAESLALAGINEMTRETLRQTWPMIREGVEYALKAALAPTSSKEPAPGQPTREQVEVARQSQAKHWETLFEAKFDEEYAASLREVATIHARVGLDPCWLIAGHLTTLTELHSLVLAAHGSSMMTWSARSRLERAIRAVDQAVLFDLQLRVAAYTEELARLSREKMLQVVRQLQHPAPPLTDTLLPPTVASRKTASELFVASQRHIYRDVTVDHAPGDIGGTGTIAFTVAVAPELASVLA